ncbi:MULTISPECIES: response regulator transcription factor [unclassified Pseudomonas]|jgi:FixJ family two-component response regulator|uniref:response regulator transcription factor n=1 Tax=unclassified Pseudomonas TaxID=196821 RepID=UPI0008BDE2BC|nr:MULTISPECIES: response regulator transcription factor [unclassified Pseudomonas]SEJ48107.1 Two-component response regulator, FixJ family, consists of REC and HTH domains [Pseudomonas sp. NFR16]
MTPVDKSPIVFVVDDDPAIRAGLDSLLRSVGMRVYTYASGAEFLQHAFEDAPACLILDVRLQGESGLDFQVRLAEMKVSMPIVFVSGHGDIAMSVKAMKAGALDFLVKPFREQDLLDAVTLALQKDSKRRETGKVSAELRARFQTLTAREQEVMSYAVTGLMNKQIASEMGLSEITVKIHRGHAMKKMQARTFADLVKMSEALAGE